MCKVYKDIGQIVLRIVQGLCVNVVQVVFVYSFIYTAWIEHILQWYTWCCSPDTGDTANVGLFSSTNNLV